MLEEILSKISFISPIFYQVLYMTVIGSVVGILIYFVRNIFDKKISGKWECIMWCIALVTFLIPIRIEIKTDKPVVMQSEIIDSFGNIKYINQESSRVTEPNKEKNGILDFSDSDDEVSNKKSFENMNQVVNEDNNMTSIQIAEEQKLNTDIKELILNILIPSVWMFGILIFITTFIIGSRRINKRISKNIYKDERLENILSMCKKQLVIKKKINIVLQSYKKVPSIFGILNPSILITEETLEQDNQTIKYIFLHELSHYKRKDLIFNYILLCVLSIHWFNPVVWFLFKKIRQDIEIGADELASKKLDKNEKKEYGMVLINLLKNRTGENYTASMLCMSDTGKNMERRIHMIKGKSKSAILSFILVIIVFLVVVSFIFIKVIQVEDVVNVSNQNNLDSEINKEENELSKPNNNEVSDNDKQKITQYIDILCNDGFSRKISEFENINDADKYWIYGHLSPQNEEYSNENVWIFPYSTKEELENELKDLFGPELVVNLEKDINENEDLLSNSKNINYNKEHKVYEFYPYGIDTSNYYAINSIKKNNNEFIVNVVEYMETDNAVTGRYIDTGKYYHLVYSTLNGDNIDGTSPEIAKKEAIVSESKEDIRKWADSEVLKQKNQFKSFNIILMQNNDGKFYLKSIEKE